MTTTPLKNNMFWVNFRQNIRMNKKMLIIVSVLQMLSLPVMALILNIDAASSGTAFQTTNIPLFLAISIFCLCVAVFCGIVIAINNFSYLYKKTEVDMVYSLPIKRKYKFLSDFFSGLFVYTVPYIIGSILSVIIILSGGVCIDNMKEIINDHGIIPLIIQAEAAGLFIMILIYTLTVFVLNCCGTLFESILNIIMINALIPGIILVISAMLFANLYGVSIMNTVIPLIGYTSPAGAGIYLVYELANKFEYSNWMLCLSAAVYTKWLIIFLIFTCIIFAISMVLYLKRKAESVSKPYVYKVLYYITVTTIVMAISLIARYDFSTVIPVIVFSLIVYLIFEIITNRGFKKIYKSLIRYAVTMVAILVLCIIAKGTNGFGVLNYVPSADSVSSVDISYSGFDNYTGDYSVDYYSDGGMVNYTEKEVIDTIIEVQKDNLDKFNNNEFYYESDIHEYSNYYDYYDYEAQNDYEITLVYHLKNGSSVRREYYLTFEELRKLCILDSTKEYQKYLEKRIFKGMEYDNDNYREQDDSRQQHFYETYIANILGSTTNELVIDKQQATELAKAYAKDYCNTTPEQLMTEDLYCYIDSYPVRKSFKNTIEVLKKCKASVPPVTESDLLYADVSVYSPGTIMSWGDANTTATFGDYQILKGSGITKLNNYDLCRMLNEGLLKKPYYENKQCYMIFIDGTRYIVPSDRASDFEAMLGTSGDISDSETRSDVWEVIDGIRNDSAETYAEINGFDANQQFISELNYICNLSYYNYNNFSSFEDFYNSYYDSEYRNDNYEEKLKWDHWHYFIKFFGYAGVDSYLSDNPDAGRDKTEREWNIYASVFPEAIKQFGE